MPGIASGNVDERIVEMRIDHEKFESGARKTISILERLDAGLKSLSGQNADGFDQIADSLEAVDKKFSVFGTIGDQVLRNLTNKAMELVGQLRHVANELTLDQVGAGWNKYAEKTQGVQTIMAATAKDWEDQGAQMEWVNAQLEKLNWFTDETSYNFLEMVNNIGKFTSNGVKLETAVTSMEGISTWAALSGANANEASRAMYNLSQALATGTVKLIDWKSIENANMATREFKELALETAVSLGTLTKVGDNTFKTLGEKGKEFTTEQFNTELSEGWFTSDVLLSVLNQYGKFTDVLNAASNATDLTATEMLEAVDAYEKGEEGLQDIQRICDKSHLSIEELMPWLKELSSDTYELGRRAFKAAQEAKTFQEAIDATKDAVSTAWMNVFEKIFGSYLEAKEFWTDVAESLYNIFAEPINQLGELVDLAFGDKLNREMDELQAQANFDELTAGLHDLGYSFKSFEDAYRRIDGKAVDDLVSKYGSLENAIKKGAVSAKDFQDIMLMLAGTNEYISKTPVYDSAGHIKAFEPVYHKIITLTGERLAIYNKLIGASGRLTNTEESGLEYITTGSELFTEGLANMLGVIEDVTKAIDHAMQLLFGDNTDPKNIIPWTDVLGEKLYGSLEKFNEFAEALRFDEEKGEIEALGEKIAAVASVFVTARNIISSVFGFLMSVVTGIIKALGQSRAIEHIFKAISNVVQGLLAPLRFFASLVQTAFETLAGEKLGNFNWVQMLTRFFMQLGIRLEILSKRFREFMESEEVALIVAAAFEKLQDVLTWITNKLGNAFTKLVDLAEELKQAFGEGGLTKAFDVLKVKVSAFLKKHQVLQKVFEGLKTVLMLLLAPLALVGAGLMTVFTYLKNVIDKLKVKIDKEGFAGVLSSINLRIEEFIKKHPKLESALKWIQKQISRISNLMLRLQTAFSANGFSGVFSVISDEINQFLANHPKLASFITFVQNAFENIKNLASQAWKSISEFFSNIDWTTIFSNMPSWEDIGQFFSGLYTSIVTWFADLKNKFKTGGLTAALQTIVDTITKFFNKPKNFLKPIGDALSNLFKDFDITQLFDFIKNLGDSLSGLGVGLIALNLAKLVRTLSWVFDEFSGLIGVPRMNAIAKIITAIGTSFLMLAGSIVVLSLLPTDKVKAVGGILVDVLLSIAIVIGAVKLLHAEGSLLALAGIIGGLVLIVAALYALTYLSDNYLEASIDKGIWRLVEIMAIMLVFVKLANNINISGLGKLVGLSISVLIFVGALYALVNLVDTHLLTSIGEAMNRLIEIVFILAAFLAITRSLNGGSVGKMIGVAIAVLAFVYVINKLIDAFDDNTFTTGWTRLGMILLEMAGFMAAIAFANSKNALLKFGAGLLLSAAAIYVFALGLEKIGEVLPNFVANVAEAGTVLAENWKTFLLGTLIFGLLAVAVGFMISQFVKLFSGGFGSKFASFAGNISTGVGKIVKGIGTGLKNAVPDLQTILGIVIIGLGVYFINKIPEIVPLFVSGITTLFSSVAASLDENKDMLAESLASVISSIVSLAIETLTLLTDKLIESFKESFKTSLSVSDGNAFDLSGILLSIFTYIVMPLILVIGIISRVSGAFHAIGPIVAGVFNPAVLSGFIASLSSIFGWVVAIALIVAGLRQGFIDLNGQFEQAEDTRTEELFGDANAGIDDRIKKFAELRDTINEYNEAVDAATNKAVETGDTSELDRILAERQNYELQVINAESELARDLAEVTGESYRSVIAELRNADDLTQTEIYRKYLEIVSKENEQLKSDIAADLSPDSMQAEKALQRGSTTVAPSSTDVATVTSDEVTVTTSEIEANQGVVQESWMDMLTGAFSAGATDPEIAGLLQQFGLSTDTQLAGFIGENGQILTDGMAGTLFTSFTAAGNDPGVKDANYWNGYNAAAGVANGIYEGGEQLVEAASSWLTSLIPSTMSSGLDINSPSRVMARLAEYIPAGVAVGIERNSGVAVDSITVLGSSILAAMQMAMLKVATVADERFDITPVITPVVDTTNMDYAAGMAGGMFGRITSGLRGTIDVNADRADALASAANASTDKGSMFGEIQRLSDKLESLGDAIMGMQIVLDTGELVGATSPQMDAAFGTMQMRKGRGN